MQNNQSVLIIHSGPKQGEARVPKWGWGEKYPYCDFGLFWQIFGCFDRGVAA